uniref:Uncharacterized protein n=1 Tax=Arundo donax TaxID=35708 RepID=A0A0A9EAK2_ARUDO
MLNIRFRAQVCLEALITECSCNRKLAIYTRNITYQKLENPFGQFHIVIG